MKRFLALSVLVLSAAASRAADPLADFSSRVHRITLKNGFRALVVERPESPTVSFSMYIRTGGLDDEMGKSGMAHMFEHMLFKGTKTIGTTDYEKEKIILDQLDAAEAKGDEAEIARLEKEHEKYNVPEEYWQIYERAGGQDLNASTGYDFTDYVISLPVNQVKLWMVMEADRIRNPVLREFYKERSVVMEERRLRVDTSPNGKLWENFLAAAFVAHPYGRPIVGWESDISRINRKETEAFFKQHYDISRLVLAVVGGVKAADIEKMLRTYIEPIPSLVRNHESVIPVEPAQEGERRVNVEYDAEPALLVGYHRPGMTHDDGPALEVAAELFDGGRTSRFNRHIVEKDRVAVSAWAGSTLPGERDPCLFAFGGQPRAPHTVADLEKAIDWEITLMKDKGPTELELETVKNKIEADLLRGLSSNSGLANQLAYYESVAGDWEFLFKLVRRTRAVTGQDVQRVLQKYLVPSNRTVAVLVKKK
jgi:predicted Zn-dependent peptidase